MLYILTNFFIVYFNLSINLILCIRNKLITRVLCTKLYYYKKKAVRKIELNKKCVKGSINKISQLV